MDDSKGSGHPPGITHLGPVSGAGTRRGKGQVESLTGRLLSGVADAQLRLDEREYLAVRGCPPASAAGSSECARRTRTMVQDARSMSLIFPTAQFQMLGTIFHGQPKGMFGGMSRGRNGCERCR